MQTSVEGFRLSPQQRRLWSLCDRDGDATYRVLCAVSIAGPLDTATLKSSVEAVVARHEILRTTFQNLISSGVPVQVINDRHPAVKWELELNLNGVPEREQQSCLDELLETLKDAPFELGAGPVLRATLLHFSPVKKILLIGLPALCSDATGIKNLVRQIASTCESTRNDDEPLQYADIAEYLSGLLEERNAGAEYWSGYDLAQLCASRPHFQRRAPAARRVEQRFQKVRVNLGPRVDEIAQPSDLFILSCWHALLGRLAGEREVIVGVAFDGRRVEGLGELPGAFVKYLPLDIKPAADESFAQLMTRISERTATHAEWQDYFAWNEGIGDQPETYLPLCFDYAEFGEPYRAGAAVMSLVSLYSCNERFDLKLSGIRIGNELFAEFHFDARSFDRQDIECLAEQFVTLAHSAAANPGLPISKLNLLNQDQRHRLVYELNQTAQDYARSKHVHRMVEHHAESTPNELAVVCGEEQVSYRELNARANQLAHHLIAQGIGPDVLAGICLERSVPMLVAILAVLKAGGAYLPLDPSYPRERLRFMIDNAAPGVVITERRLMDRLNGPRPVLVDEHEPAISRQSEQNPARAIAEDNLAYVIYTSGSTGQPKGVMITHGGLRNYLTWCTVAYDTARGNGAPVHSSLSFDLTITSLFSPLMAGRKVVLIKEDEAAAGELLASTLRRRENFSLVKITPAHLEMLALLLQPYDLPRITRALIIGGEALDAENLSFWRAHAPETRIVNEYGPTETVVGCCVHEVTPEAKITGAVPIGRPIANTQMYVLDDELSPAPFLASGEIYIGGAGLARGYLNRAGLTANTFVPNPFSREPGQRLYRTGDLARYRADGTIEFLGRIDQQVKIKGYRIELGEIETTLLGLPEVRQAVVVVREETGDKRLVGYVSLHAGMTISGSELQIRLREKLPEYMVPIITVLSSLPLTKNGKVDRDALPAPDLASSDPEKGYVAPETAEERLLVELWSKALGLGRIGVHDNFFELGGDSILSIQIANRAHAAGLRLTPRQIFQNRTIAKLATVVEHIQTARPVDEVSSGPVPLTPIQHWFFEQDLPDPHHWNQSSILELRQPIHPAVLAQAWQIVVNQHDALRLRFGRENGRWQQHCAPPDEQHTLVVKSFAGVLDDERENALATFATEFQQSLDLSAGPIARAALMDLGADKPPRLLLAIHHLAVDIVSWGVLLAELQLACEQISRNAPVNLPAKTTSFVTWARRLEHYAQSAEQRDELRYWTTVLDRWACKVPVDHSRGINSQESAHSVWVSLSEERTRALLQEVPKVYHTMINDVLLTALLQAFSDWTHSRSLLVDLENHGREDIFDDVDLSRTAGWFTCIFPLLLEIGDASRPDAVLKSVKEQIRGVPRGGIGYGLLRYLSADAATKDTLSRLPRAEICFNYLGRAGQSTDNNSPFVPKGATGLTRSPAGKRPYLIEVDASIFENQLRAAWTYSENLHSRATVESFANGFITSLEAIIDHCLSPDAGGFTPSDFSIPNLSQRELDRLIAELGGAD